MTASAHLEDLEPGIMDVTNASLMGALFNIGHMHFGAEGAGNNTAKGHYTEGAGLADMDYEETGTMRFSCSSTRTWTRSSR